MIKNKKGILEICTGAGKSKIAIDYYDYLFDKSKNLKVLLIVPTEKLRDINWLNEFKDWNKDYLYNQINFTRSCYASISKIKNQEFDLVIGDEIHNITDNNKVFFTDNIIHHIIGLSATIPEEKRLILDELNLNTIFYLSLDEGVKKGIVAPYEIKIIELSLDDKDKYIKAGSKEKPFFLTEKKQYDYFNKLLRTFMFTGKEMPSWLILKRKQFLNNSKSKTVIAKKLLASLSQDDKIIIFCGSIDQANELSEHTFHSRSDDTGLLKFMNDEVNRLSCVNALNEGMNIQGIDVALIVQADSKEKNLIQRIGRACRFREGHLAAIYILSLINTQDEKWVEKAIENLDKSKIEYINIKNLNLK